MSLQAIRKVCKQKLVRTHQAHRTQAKIDIAAADKRTQVMAQIAAKEEKRRKGDRMIARCHGVCYPFKLPFHFGSLNLKTLARRKKIASRNRSRDPEKWDAVHKIIDTLGVEGMSGDETDCPPAAKPKALRRLELPWINPGISRLFQSVDVTVHLLSHGIFLLSFLRRTHLLFGMCSYDWVHCLILLSSLNSSLVEL